MCPYIDAMCTFKAHMAVIDFSDVIWAANPAVMNLCSAHVIGLIFRTSDLVLMFASYRVLVLYWTQSVQTLRCFSTLSSKSYSCLQKVWQLRRCIGVKTKSWWGRWHMLQLHWRFPEAQWPPSFQNGTKITEFQQLGQRDLNPERWGSTINCATMGDRILASGWELFSSFPDFSTLYSRVRKPFFMVNKSSLEPGCAFFLRA